MPMQRLWQGGTAARPAWWCCRATAALGPNLDCGVRLPRRGAVQVLKLEPSNVKALFRRGKARHTLGQTDGALPDLEQAYKL